MGGPCFILNHGPPIGEIIWEIFLEIFREIFLETFSCQKIISIWPTLTITKMVSKVINTTNNISNTFKIYENSKILKIKN